MMPSMSFIRLRNKSNEIYFKQSQAISAPVIICMVYNPLPDILSVVNMCSDTRETLAKISSNKGYNQVAAITANP